MSKKCECGHGEFAHASGTPRACSVCKCGRYFVPTTPEYTHRVVYITQSRVEEFVTVDPKSGTILHAGPMLQLFIGANLSDIRTKKMVTKLEMLNPPVDGPSSASSITLTDAL